MERWRFHIISDAEGEPVAIRMYLRSGDEESAWPKLQVKIDGSEVPVDAAEIDYEAPEWKAIEILKGGGSNEARWEELKEKMRTSA